MSIKARILIGGFLAGNFTWTIFSSHRKQFSASRRFRVTLTCLQSGKLSISMDCKHTIEWYFLRFDLHKSWTIAVENGWLHHVLITLQNHVAIRLAVNRYIHWWRHNKNVHILSERKLKRKSVLCRYQLKKNIAQVFKKQMNT